MAYLINPDNCTKCGDCYAVCMNNAIYFENDQFIINPSWCTDCGSCEAMCYEYCIMHADLLPATSFDIKEIIDEFEPDIYPESTVEAFSVY